MLLRVVLVVYLLFVNYVDVYCLKRVKRIVGGVMAAPPPPDDPVVFVRLFGRNARIEGFRNNSTGLYSFLGIRYAEPPTYQNRFLRPQYRRLNGDLNATMNGPPCPQPDSKFPQTIIGNEDCLLLNVFTPQMPDGINSLPVLIFIHGGGFRYGSANQYGPDPVTSKKIVFVSIQYRLGTLGIIGDGTADFSGNVALFDMAAAVRWVNEYITFFGGDQNQINVLGHGSGAASAMQLTTSRAARNIISGIIAMSGTSFTKYCIDENPKQSLKEVAEINYCPRNNETELIQCLRNRNYEDLILQDSKIQSERLKDKDSMKSLTGMVGLSAVLEHSFDNRALPGILDENPKQLIKSGKFNKIRLLTGVTKDETARAFKLDDIEKSWKSVNEYLEDFSKKLNFDVIFNETQFKQTTIELPGIGDLVNLSDYLKIPKSLDPSIIIKKLTEATTDALFNLPALLTAQMWSKVAPSFLYSFEYHAQNPLGYQFLAGLPLVSNTANLKPNEMVSHGDELAFLFDLRDVFGNTLSGVEITDPKDLKVRDMFTGLVAKFVRFNESDKNNGILSPLTASGTSFIRINEDVTIENDFRFCQLSLWGAKLEAGKVTNCAFLMDQVSSLKIKAITSNITSGFSQILPNLNIPGKFFGLKRDN